MPAPNKYFLYARKSTDVEDKQVHSIEAQLAELHEFARKDGIAIDDEFVEMESAKTAGKRRIFNAMLDRIEAGEASGILSWHPDRLARNMTDGGRIIDLIDAGKIAAIKFPTTWFEPTPQGKFMLNMAFSQGKYYSDSLSVNTKRGLRDKVRRGEYPGWAPLGYLNDYRIKQVIVDRERAPLVKRAFELYATGTETVEDIRRFLAENGILTRTGKAVANTFVTRMFSDPLYYGHFRYGGEIYEGKHEAIISKSLFDDVRAVFASRFRYSPRTNKNPPKAFTGLMHCAECGYSITGELQKGHNYYRCTKKGKGQQCGQPYVREEILGAEIFHLLSPFAISNDWALAMLDRLDTDGKQSAHDISRVRSLKKDKISGINLKIDRLLDMRLDGEIDSKSYVERKERLMSERKTLEEQITTMGSSRKRWLEPFKRWIKDAQNIGEIAKTGSFNELKAFAKKVFGSNLFLDRKKARGVAVKPWAFLADNELSIDLERVFDAARSHFSGDTSGEGAVERD